RALGTGQLPGDLADIGVQVIQRGRRWRVTITVKGRAEIDEGKRQIRYSSKHRSVSRKYATSTLRGTRRALDANRIGGVLLAEASDASNYVISRAAPDAWIYSKTVTYDFIYVAAGVVIQSLSYQCTARDRDLYVRPQHRNPRAYRDFLAQASTVFPWTLPYDIDLAETRSLLRAAGLERGTLMRAALPAADAARRAAFAIEQLGMTRSELTLAIAAAAADADVWKRWGLEVTGGAATLFDSYAEVEKTDAPLTLLSTVSILLQQARLKFVELEWLLQSQFINPGLATSIQLPSDAVAGAECDPTRLTLNPCSGALLDRLHRFVRWQRRLKWSMPQLDFALRKLTALPNSTAETIATALADIESLRARLGISVETLLTGLYGFDRVSYRERKGGSINVIDPLYERTFQNPRTARAAGAGTAATRAPDPQLAYASVSGGALTITLGDYASTLAACVGLHAHDVLPLLNAEYAVTLGAAAVDATTRVTLDHLLRLLRGAFLARALRISPTRLATVIDLQ
ncbi:MAG TPA: hypothetical protein VHM19_19175, partial [Polyangiales bacterium]|nr:hypothetical protein [Polyangiales bacterium]